MNGATRNRMLEVDARLRAALLWDRPTLLGLSDSGSRQWRDALELNFVNFGELEDDLLSVAGHAAFAAFTGDQPRAAALRESLSSHGRVGELFERLLGLGLELDDAESDRNALPTVHRGSRTRRTTH